MINIERILNKQMIKYLSLLLFSFKVYLKIISNQRIQKFIFKGKFDCEKRIFLRFKERFKETHDLIE